MLNIPWLLKDKETQFRKVHLDQIFLSLGRYEGDHQVEDLIVALNYLHALIDEENRYAKRKTEEDPNRRAKDPLFRNAGF